MTSANISRTLLLGLLAVSTLGTANVSVAGPFGPSKFKIEQSDDRFSADGLTTVSGRNNRLSNRSPAGGVYIDGKGVYLDPMVIKRRADGKVQRVGFVIHNDTDQDSRFGSPNSFGSLQRVSFVIDGGKLINADVNNSELHGDGATTYNRYLKSASTDVYETGTITLGLDDMAALAVTRSLLVRIQGSAREWTCEDKQVSKQFLPNLAMFYQQQIAAVASAPS